MILNLAMSGTMITESPSEFAIFLNPILSLPMKWLYTMAPNFPWFNSFIVMVQIFALYFILQPLSKKYWQNSNYKFAIIFFLLGLILSMFISFHYTFATFLAGMAGFSCLLSLYHRDLGFKTHGLTLLPTFALFFLCAIIRFPMFKFIMLITVGYFVLLQIMEQKFLGWKFTSLLIGIVTGGFSLNLFYEYYYQSHTDWGLYSELTALTGGIHGYPGPYIRNIPLILPQLNWDVLDFQMFINWIFVDQETYNVAVFKKIHELISRPLFGFSWNSISWMWGRFTSDPRTWILSSLFLFFFTQVKWVKKDYITFIMFGSGTIFLFLTISAWGRALPQVLTCLVALFLLLAISISAYRDIDFDHPFNFSTRIWISFLRLVLVVIFSYGLIKQIHVTQARLKKTQDYYAVLDQLRSKNISLLGLTNGLLNLSPAKNLKQSLKGVDLLIMGWNSQSPFFFNHLNRLGVKSFFDDILDKPNIWFLGLPHQKRLLVQFYKKKKNIDIHFEQAGQTPFFELFRIKSTQ